MGEANGDVTPAGPPFTDPQDMRMIGPEWDGLFGFMIGRLLAAGYTPSQLQVKVRNVSNYIVSAFESAEGGQAREKLREGVEDMLDVFEDQQEGDSNG